jgi:outer membrane scaffolding protein for murein synthesis (MipA/OmpV family)
MILKINLRSFAGYDRLGDAAKDSSLIQERGEENQMSVGLGVSYRFGFDQ